MHKPLRVDVCGERRFAVEGTPADAVYVAIHSLLPERPDLVVSGINRGANIGQDVHYSGTVAAAREGLLQGIPAVAVSLHVDFSRPESSHHWEAAAWAAQQIIREGLKRGFPTDAILNINAPDIPREELKGLQACELGHHVYEFLVDERQDPRGGRYCWLGGPHSNFGATPRSEGHLVEEGWATVVPLEVQVTHHKVLAQLRGWSGIGLLESE
jgi:5'-nucleotidase